MATKANITRSIINVDLGSAKLMALAMAKARGQSLTAFMRTLVEQRVATVLARKGKLATAYKRELRRLKREV